MSTFSKNFTEFANKNEAGEEVSFVNLCKKCNGTALGTQGALILKNPFDFLSAPKKYDVDYLFCATCDILENVKDVKVEACDPDAEDFTPPSMEAPTNPEEVKLMATNKIKFSQKIHKDIFS